MPRRKKQVEEEPEIQVSEVPPELIENDSDIQSPEAGYKCPRCGANVPYFIIYGNAKYAICPSCRKKVPIKLYPPDAYRHIDTSGEKQDTSQVVERFKEGDTNYDEDLGTVSLFDTPRKPEEVLAEVLQEFSINKRFIDLAVKRSKRVGGLHPSELEKMLLTIKFSGVKDKGTAEYIASEYMYALQEEHKKAEKLGERIFYPIGLNENMEPESGGFDMYGMGMNEYGQPNSFMDNPYKTKYHKLGSTPQPQTIEKQTNDINDTVKLIKTVAGLMQPQNNNDQDLRVELERVKSESQLQMQQMMMQFQQSMNQMMQQFQTMIMQIQEENKKKEEELKAELEKERMMFMQQRMEDQISIFKDTINKYQTSMGEMREFYEKQIEMMKQAFQKEIEDLKNNTSATYREDSYRLLSDAISKASEVIEKKEPIKQIAKIATPMQPEETKFKPKKVMSDKTDIEDLINPEFVEEE